MEDWILGGNAFFAALLTLDFPAPDPQQLGAIFSPTTVFAGSHFCENISGTSSCPTGYDLVVRGLANGRFMYRIAPQGPKRLEWRSVETW